MSPDKKNPARDNTNGPAGKKNEPCIFGAETEHQKT